MEDDPLIEKHQHIQDTSVSTTNRPRINPEIDQVDIIARHEPKSDFTAHLALAIAACTLGSSFQFGYNTGIVNAPEKVLKGFYNETYHRRHVKAYLNCDSGQEENCSVLTVLWAVTVSLYCVGGMVGGVSAGYWADKFGRKKTLMLNNILMVISIVIEVSSKYLHSYEVLIVGRFFIGINAGINTGIAPMYLSEISPVSLRGLCGTFNQLNITLGVLMSTVIGLEQMLGTREHWQYALGFPLVMVVWQLCSLTLCPESPRFLFIKKGSKEEAERALIWLRGTEDVSDEMDEMVAERERAKQIKKFSVSDLIHSPELRSPLIICLVMHLSQQLSGINAVIYYSTSIFMSADLSEHEAQIATLIVGAVNVSMTFVSALMMDRLGRRTLHLFGLSGLFIASYILALGQIYNEYSTGTHAWVGYICVVAVVVYIIAFASGPGSIPWFFTAELFAQGPRPAAVSIGVLVNWSANFSVGLAYPFLQEKINAFSFIPFIVFLAIFWVYTLYNVPETKGKTIDEITALFKDENSQQYQRLPVDDED